MKTHTFVNNKLGWKVLNIVQWEQKLRISENERRNNFMRLWIEATMPKILLENSIVKHEISVHPTPLQFSQFNKEKSKQFEKSGVWMSEKSYVIFTQVRASSGNSV